MTLFLIGCEEKTANNKAGVNMNNSEFVEVYEEPKHQLVFETNDLKILDIQINPNDTTLYHRHKYPMLYVSLGWQKYASQNLNADWNLHEGLPIGEVVLDTTFQTLPIVHRVANLGTHPSRLMGIMNTGKGVRGKGKSNDAESPNRWFYLQQIKLNPNDTINFQKLEYPTVIVLVAGNEIEILKGNKSKIHSEQWLYLEGMSQLINSSNHKIELVQIEVLN